jgi:DNA-binding NarL/FixJ family response regulator
MPDRSSPPTPTKRRILIVDNHSLLRHGLITLINDEPDLHVCAEAATQQTGLAAIRSSEPDLVITDLMLQEGDGSLDFVREIRASHESLPVLVLSMHDAPHYVRTAFRAGANGYVCKQEMIETLLLAIRSVLRGEKYVSLATGAGSEGT